MSLQAEIRQLELDRQLLGILPETLQEQWQKYRPIGVIDADLTLEFDGQTWRPEPSEASISFSNISFTHYKFPYRVDHGKGSLELKNDLLALEHRRLQRQPAGAAEGRGNQAAQRADRLVRGQRRRHPDRQGAHQALARKAARGRPVARSARNNKLLLSLSGATLRTNQCITICD